MSVHCLTIIFDENIHIFMHISDTVRLRSVFIYIPQGCINEIILFEVSGQKLMWNVFVMTNQIDVNCSALDI